MQKQNKHIQWASGEGSFQQEPLESQRLSGWKQGDVPTASTFNWLFHQIGQWHEYLEYRIDHWPKDESWKPEVQNVREHISRLEVELKDQLAAMSRQLMNLQIFVYRFHPPETPVGPGKPCDMPPADR